MYIEQVSRTHPYRAVLAQRVPATVMDGIFGIVRRSVRPFGLPAGVTLPYIAVVMNDVHKTVLRYSDEAWLSDACIAEICFRAP